MLNVDCENLQLLNGKLYFMPWNHNCWYGSVDGLSWAIVQNTPSPNYDITYGNGLYVTIGAFSGGHATSYTSPDGVNWTQRSIIGGAACWTIAYGAGRFVIGVTNGHFYYSTDAINWTDGGRIDASNNQEIYRIKFLNGKFWALSNFGNKLSSSPDGLAWTTLVGTWTRPQDIAYGNGIYAMADGGGNVFTSPDGVNWTARAFPMGKSVNCIAYGNGFFVAGAGNQPGRAIYYSTDCINWTLGRAPGWAPSSAIYLGNNKFVIAAG